MRCAVERLSRVGKKMSLEPEGEAEVPEIITVSDAVEGTFVDQSRREQVEAKLSERGREISNGEGM